MITAEQLKDIKERTEALNRYLDIEDVYKRQILSFSRTTLTIVKERLTRIWDLVVCLSHWLRKILITTMRMRFPNWVGLIMRVLVYFGI